MEKYKIFISKIFEDSSQWLKGKKTLLFKGIFAFYIVLHKTARPNYLREYLHFILSYIKPQGQTSGNNPESQTGTISGASQASTEEESQHESPESQTGTISGASQASTEEESQHESEGVASIQESATEEVRSQSEPYTAASSNLTRSEPSTPYGRRRKRAIPI
ncbi:hypothetical protein QE152_g16017 [Popillia japonica]|uniref:Uncharacterized protein n=1 Tax=Popillia japonica TaxID=7064 RepID=A0AAW1L7B7_POPJA